MDFYVCVIEITSLCRSVSLNLRLLVYFELQTIFIDVTFPLKRSVLIV